MTSIRNLFYLVLGLTITAFALPADAAKVYTLNMAAPSGLYPGGTGQAVTATYANISSDTGNSNVSSLKLYAPSGITIKTPTDGIAVNLGNGYTATIKNNGTSIFVSSIQPPLKPFAATPLSIPMTVDVTCTATGVGWTSRPPYPTGTADQVWNGSNFTGQTFTFTNTAPNTSNTSTPVSGVCGTISFVNQPATTFAGYAITTTAYNNPTGAAVSVNLTINNAPATDGTPVNLSVSLGSCSITGGSATTVNGVATFPNLISTTTGTGCTLTASGGGVHPDAVSNAFDIVGPAGTLACASTGAADAPVSGTLDPFAAPEPPYSPAYGLVRGLNTDGTCGDAVPWSLTLDTANQAFTFTEDSLGQPTSVQYVILWPKVNKDSDGWSGKQPCVSWGVTNPVWTPDTTYGCKGDFAPALLCVINNVDGGTAVMPTIPNQPPYNLATPILDTQYQYDGTRKAKVCVVQQGMTVDSGQVQYWTTFIDQADTVGRMP